MSAADTEFGDWIGRRETTRDQVSVASVAGMLATLDRDGPEPQPGDPLPPLWHWMYFAPKAPQSQLGPDGHPKRGHFLPPVPLPRRMFAGSRITFHAPLRVGVDITRDSEIADIVRKTGRTGELVFVTVRHRISGPAGLALEEEQDIVYRGLDAPAQTPTKVTAEIAPGDWQRTVTPDPVMLFRYSALTFNGHRIHYDQPYVTRVEGYPGLVVHGPLIATLLMELAREQTDDRPVARFAFQGKRPLFDIAPFTVTGRLSPGGRGCSLHAVDPDGAVAMTATVEFADG